MITEDYVSFDMAKLLKEKGFDGECDLFGRTDESELIIREAAKIAYTQGIDDECVVIPTLQMAMKWLREVHKIFIDVDYDSDEFKDSPYFSLIINMNTNDYFKGYGLPQEKSTYEEACEAAIKYCLENLI